MPSPSPVSHAERIARVRDAVARARSATARVRELLAATERLLAVMGAMLLEERTNVVLLRGALDTMGATRRAADDALLLGAEAADRVLDALGAGTRLVTQSRTQRTDKVENRRIEHEIITLR